MISFPTAKINIGLNIISKREDGFHHIESIFYAVGLCDALEIVENKEQTNEKIIFSSSGIEIPGEQKDNLCCRAFHLINHHYPLPNIKIHLHKNIPIGAGLGGGSADAAFFIHLLNDTFKLQMPISEMEHFASQLGSDCAFFIQNKPALVEGKGDKFINISLDLSKYFIAIIYPHIHINTAKAYSNVNPRPASRSLKNDVLHLPVEEWKDNVHNDFEDSVFPQYPALKEIKNKLYSYGALYSSMSGSGSSVFGIFKEPSNLKEHFKDSFVWEGQI